jgi:hypothetical protein
LPLADAMGKPNERRSTVVKKRSALMVAGGLVGALLSAVAGYSIRLTGAQPVAAEATRPALKPIVRTITSTIRIKKKPKVRHVSAPVPSSAVVAPSSSSSTSTPPTTSTGGSHSQDSEDDEGEHEGGDD